VLWSSTELLGLHTSRQTEEKQGCNKPRFAIITIRTATDIDGVMLLGDGALIYTTKCIANAVPCIKDCMFSTKLRIFAFC
jgi:hypothetical protein